MPQRDRITFDPNGMGGKPCLREMRSTVGTIVDLLATGATAIDLVEMEGLQNPFRRHHIVNGRKIIYVAVAPTSPSESKEEKP